MAQAIVVSSHMSVAPSGQATLDGYSYVAEYKIKTDKQAVGMHVVNEAVNATPDPLPALRDSLNVTVGGEVYTDSAVQCSSIQCDHTDETRTEWIARVTWSTPSPGDQTTPPDTHLEPFSRTPRWSFDWLSQRIRRDDLIPTTTISWFDGSERTADDATNSKGYATAGHGFLETDADDTIEQRRAVLIYRRNVSDSFEYLTLEPKWVGQQNASPWEAWHLVRDGLVPAADGLTVDPKKAMVWEFRSLGPFFWQEVPYYTLQCKIIVDPKEWNVFVENLGSKFWDFAPTFPSLEGNLDARGHFGGLNPMTARCAFAKTQAEAVDTIQFYSEANGDFDELMTDIKAVNPPWSPP